MRLFFGSCLVLKLGSFNKTALSQKPLLISKEGLSTKNY
jgi:hypothetical protein